MGKSPGRSSGENLRNSFMMIIGGPRTQGKTQGKTLVVKAPGGKYRNRNRKKVTIDPLINGSDDHTSSGENLSPNTSVPGIHGTQQIVSGYQSVSDEEQIKGGFLSVAESERIILSAREDNSNVRLCNTNTGTVKVETRGKVKNNIVEESCHQACFIIQMLLIAGLRCICFFDSGANNQIVQILREMRDLESYPTEPLRYR